MVDRATAPCGRIRQAASTLNTIRNRVLCAFAIVCCILLLSAAYVAMVDENQSNANDVSTVTAIALLNKYGVD